MSDRTVFYDNVTHTALDTHDVCTIEDALEDAAELLDDKLSELLPDYYTDEDRLVMKSRLARYQVLGAKLKGSL